MQFEKVVDLDEKEFRRLTGIKRTTFEKILVILTEENRK
jgi:hypothetical protein